MREFVRRLFKKLPDLPPIVNGPHGQEFIFIPEGPFIMGSTEDELKELATQWGDLEVIKQAHLFWESPQHEVHSPTYYIGKYPVTNAEWREFYISDGYQNEGYWPVPEVLHDLHRKQPYFWSQPQWSKPDHPVVGISFDECIAYCKWLSERMSRPIRLLTEAEWEKAAGWNEKKKIRQRYPWGDDWDQSRCNSFHSKIEATTSVKQYSPIGDSPYGVADMAGNVSEYCSTYFMSYDGKQHKEYRYPYTYDDGRDKLIFNSWAHFQSKQILRGGNWSLYWLGCRNSFRQTVSRGLADTSFGVRVGFSAEL